MPVDVAGPQGDSLFLTLTLEPVEETRKQGGAEGPNRKLHANQPLLRSAVTMATATNERASTRRESPEKTEAGEKQVVSRARGRSVEIPRMSKHLRSALEAVAGSMWEARQGEEGSSEPPAIRVPRAIALEDGKTLKWTAGGSEESTRLNASEMRGALRSLLANGFGRVFVEGLGAVSWNTSARVARGIAIEEGVGSPPEAAVPRPPGDVASDAGPLRLEKKGIRDTWSSGAERLLSGAESAWITLNERGRALAGNLWAWHRAKKAGVPLGRARSNENLPAGYLSPKDRREPGRHRSRSLWADAVDGTEFYGKKTLFARGTPPEMEDDHREADEKTIQAIRDLEVQPGTLFGQGARPTTYITARDETYKRTNQYIALENGMLLPVRECLYLMDRFPDGVWTTGHLEMTIEPSFGGEPREVSETYAVVVDEQGALLGAVPPYEKRVEDVIPDAG